MHAGRDREHRRELDDAPGAGRELGDEPVGVAAEAEEVDELGGLGALRPLGARSTAGSQSSVPQNDVALARLERELHRLAHGQLGEQRRGLERAAEPGARPAVRGRARADVVARAARPCPSAGTKPPIALSSVDLPGAVRADEADHLAGLGVEVDAVDRDDAAEAHA